MAATHRPTPNSRYPINNTKVPALFRRTGQHAHTSWGPYVLISPMKSVLSSQTERSWDDAARLDERVDVGPSDAQVPSSLGGGQLSLLDQVTDGPGA
jgi:hypothetical protein